MLHDIAHRIDHVLGFAEPHRAGFGDPEARTHHADVDILQRRRRRVGRERPVAVDAVAPPTRPPHRRRSARRCSALTSSRLAPRRRCRPSRSAAVKRARRSPPGALNSGTSGRGRAAGCAARIFARKASRVVISAASGFSCTTRGRFGSAPPASRAACPRCSAGYTARSSAAAASAPPIDATVARYSVGLASSRPAIFSTSCFTNGTSWRSAITLRHL